MTNKWIKHYQAMVRGELPNKKFYTVSNTTNSQQGSGDIKVVAPTEQAVQQAKMAVKRKLELLPKRSKKRKNVGRVKTKREVKKKLKSKKGIKRASKKKKSQSKSRSSRGKATNKLKYL